MYLARSLAVLGSTGSATGSVLGAATAGALAGTDAVGLIGVGTDGVGWIDFVGDGIENMEDSSLLWGTSFGAGDGIATLEDGGLLGGVTTNFGVGSPRKLSLSKLNECEVAALGRFRRGLWGPLSQCPKFARKSPKASKPKRLPRTVVSSDRRPPWSIQSVLPILAHSSHQDFARESHIWELRFACISGMVTSRCEQAQGFNHFEFYHTKWKWIENWCHSLWVNPVESLKAISQLRPSLWIDPQWKKKAAGSGVSETAKVQAATLTTMIDQNTQIPPNLSLLSLLWGDINAQGSSNAVEPRLEWGAKMRFHLQWPTSMDRWCQVCQKSSLENDTMATETLSELDT